MLFLLTFPLLPLFRRYFGRRFPRIQLQEFVWAKDTRYLRRQLWKFKFAQEVRQELVATSGPHSCSWICSVRFGCRDLTYWTARERELWQRIQTARQDVHNGDYTVHLLFLTVGSPQQAYRLQMLEENLGSTYRRMSLAPRNQDIVWDNMKSGIYLWTYYLCWGSLIIFFWTFAITPFAWKENFMQLLDKIGLADVSESEFISIFPIGVTSLLNSAIFFTINLLPPYFVKLAVVRFGTWDGPRMLSQYMIFSFLVTFSSIIVAPYLRTGDIFEVLDFIFTQSRHQDVRCLYQPSSGAFFVNYLIISALGRSQSQLHRVGDLAYRLWSVLIHCCSRAERAVAWRDAEAFCRATNTYDNIGLVNNYDWLLLQFAGTVLLCLIFPLVR